MALWGSRCGIWTSSVRFESTKSPARSSGPTGWTSIQRCCTTRLHLPRLRARRSRASLPPPPGAGSCGAEADSSCDQGSIQMSLQPDALPRPTASYEADPEQVGRVLLLYSGGLDTSVMLKWIQERYGAEVVTLTVNLGQPGEDYAVIEGKALQLGAVECHIVDAREEFADEYLAPAIKANALYGGGYPLFTALGRPLIAKLAVEYARRS